MHIAVTKSRSGASLLSDFDEFYRGSFDRVFAATYAWSGDRELARDATQEAFARAYARWNRLQREAWTLGWVTTTAINVCRRQRRKTANEVHANAPEVQTSVRGATVRMDVLLALQKLPPRRRQAVVLKYLADYPISTVAELMKISEGAVKSHIAKAKEALRGFLATS